MKSKLLIIIGVIIAVAASATVLFLGADIDENNTMIKNNAEILYEINQQAIIYRESENQEKFDQQATLMQEKIKEIATDSLGMDIAVSNIHQAYFPIKKGSQIDITGNQESFQICDVVENIPIHLQEIRKSKMFQMFAKKYSGYPIELFLQDERRHNSEFHYGLIATSGDAKSALTYFHANSCTNEITDLDDYFLSCHDKEDVFGTKNKDDIITSLNLDEFCTIRLDSWRQAVQDYSMTLSKKTMEQAQKFEDMGSDNEKAMELQLEMNRLGLLTNLVNMIVYDDFKDEIMQEKIREYNKVFGSLPEELLELIENRK